MCVRVCVFAWEVFIEIWQMINTSLLRLSNPNLPLALTLFDVMGRGWCSKARAVSLVEPEHVSQLLHPRFTETAMQDHAAIATGLPASPGAAVGQIVLDAETAARWKSDGKTVLLVRETTSPEDVGGMWAAEGVLTTRGVRTPDSTSNENTILLLLQFLDRLLL